jgi:peptide chain release factor 2
LLFSKINSCTCRNTFDTKAKKEQIQALTKKSEDPLFWDDPKSAGESLQSLESLKKEVLAFEGLVRDITDLEEMSLLETDASNEELSQEYERLEQELLQWEVTLLLSGPYDNHGALVTLRSGAGGVDAQDWADMLTRMYIRFAEKNARPIRVIEEVAGTEAGIKSATLEIGGQYAYGFLKGEAGIHRLVRLSPFNANNLRQTSFASVEVLPVINEDKEVTLLAEDIRIDTYKSGGAGGQHVNTTDSAVRITHIPTGIVVTSQSERSQLQNKEEALKTLRGKLAQKRLEELTEEKRALRGEHKKAEWGNQIRSYVLHPYTMVKDHRTSEETTDVRRVLEGDIQAFLETSLRFLNL